MADETKKPRQSDRETSPVTSSADPGAESDGEIIDLEGLVRDIDLTPTGSIGVAEVAADSAPLHAEALSHEQIEAILLEEDPALAAEIEAIRSVVVEKENLDKSFGSDELANHKDKLAMTWRQRLGFIFLKLGSQVRSLKSLVGRAAKDSKGVFREILIRVKVSIVGWLRTRKAGIDNKLGWIASRSRAQKISMLVSIVALAGLIFVLSQTVQGTLLPKTEKVWVASFADHADGTFKYDQGGAFEDFNDPLLHPEFVVLIERIVVNLSRTPEARDSANPMAAFELYLQTDTQDAAIEIKDRNVEARDVIARSVERMTYPDLADEDGKTKLKLLIRKDLNEVLTKGKVRRVFFKTLVLNPEE